MDKLEHYLDRVCRGIAGPRSLRQHIRQELREHLIDAASEHENAGLTHEEAIDRAIEEFGGPDEVREQLEATHGHRLMTLVVDKAMQWKEKTMKAKWLWVTWAHIALVLVITVEVLFVAGAVTFVLPRFFYYYDRGWLRADVTAPPIELWAYHYFRSLINMMENWALWVVPLAVLWGLFEWRVRSENKSMIRLALLGTAAFKMLIVTFLTAFFMIIPLSMEMPAMYRRNPEPDVREALSDLRTALPAVETALAARDWENVRGSLHKVEPPVRDLAGMGAAAPVIVSMNEEEQVNAARGQIAEAFRAINGAGRAAYYHDAPAVEEALRKARALLDQARQTTRPAP